MNDALPVDISQSTAQLSYPEPNRILGERLSRYVEPQVAAAHQVDHKIPAWPNHQRGFNSKVAESVCLHVLDILETVPQVTDERMIYLLQHSALTYDIADTLGSYN